MKDGPRGSPLIFSAKESHNESSAHYWAEPQQGIVVESDNIMKQEWRRYGAARRKELIEKDEQEGGTRFDLHKKCRIEQYFNIADRVSPNKTRNHDDSDFCAIAKLMARPLRPFLFSLLH